MAELLAIKWLTEPEDHNYPAALSYLSLIYDEGTAAKMVDDLRVASITQFKAKDIFRSSSLSLLGVSNSHVNNDRKKIKKGTSLCPILLERTVQTEK
jgi:hypothetical protein